MPGCHKKAVCLGETGHEFQKLVSNVLEIPDYFVSAAAPRDRLLDMIVIVHVLSLVSG